MNGQFSKGLKYELFIGLKDKDSYEELFSIEDFKKILTEICAEKNICFSLLTQLGGYTHNKGYTTETSLRIILIGADSHDVTLLSERLKKSVNTDTIMITKSEIEYAYL